MPSRGARGRVQRALTPNPQQAGSPLPTPIVTVRQHGVQLTPPAPDWSRPFILLMLLLFIALVIGLVGYAVYLAAQPPPVY